MSHGHDTPVAATLQIGEGDGILVRRASDLLFVADSETPALTLVDALRSAPAGDAIDAVTSAALGDTPLGFVVVDWGHRPSDRVRLALFGDLRVVSDAPSMPRLSAAGSGTWVERTLRVGATVTLSIGQDGADPLTALDHGTVRAGGFRLVLAPPASTPAGEIDPHARRAERAPIATPDPTPSPATPPDSGTEHLLDMRATRHDPTMDYDGVVPGVGHSDPDATDAPHEPSGPAAPTFVPWRLRFDDGSIVGVDGPLVLGRSPRSNDPEARKIALSCREMSADHVRVRPEADHLVLTDLGSRNRTWTITSGDRQLVSLEPHVATRFEPGVHVQIGSKVFVIERVPADADAG